MSTLTPLIDNPTLAAKPRRVLFVCLGNICRSPAAEEIFRQTVIEALGNTHGWTIDSAGMGNWHAGQLPDHRMRVHARRRGLELSHHARQVSSLDFDRFDLIIPMDATNESDLRQLAPTPEDLDKIIPMARFFTMATRHDHVPDPYYQGAEGFELVLDLLSDACLNLYNVIR